MVGARYGQPWRNALAVGAFCLTVLSVATMPALAAVQVIDDSGARVGLSQPARRIVSLAPHLTELLFEAGAGGRIVGAAAHSDFPQEARTIPRIGDARALDLERIVALRPELIVAWSSGSPRRQLERLQALGLAVFRNEPASLDGIAVTLERLGTLAGTTPTAHAQAARFRMRLAQLRAVNVHARPISVFYQVWERPLLTVSSKHVIDDALRSCGARNVFARHGTLIPRPSREAVLLSDPEAIIVADPSGNEGAALESWQRWRHLRAVKRGNLFTIDPNLMHRHTSRILDGVALLCAHVRSVQAREH
jgi:iron complex transport system substrate-binding protein